MQVNLSLDTSNAQDVADLQKIAEAMSKKDFTQKTGEALKEILQDVTADAPTKSKATTGKKPVDEKASATPAQEQPAEDKDAAGLAGMTALTDEYAGEAGLEKIRAIAKGKKSKEVKEVMNARKREGLGEFPEEERAELVEAIKNCSDK